MADIQTLDAIALGVLGAAMLRGVWIGMIRESFSLAALAGAFLAVRFGTAPLAEWLVGHAPFTLAPLTWRVLCGVALGIASIAVIGALGRGVRRGMREVGLGLLDRLAGGALGAAEGALAVGLVVLVLAAVVGRDHPPLQGSRALAVLERARQAVGGPPDVASPPPQR